MSETSTLSDLFAGFIRLREPTQEQWGDFMTGLNEYFTPDMHPPVLLRALQNVIREDWPYRDAIFYHFMVALNMNTPIAYMRPLWRMFKEQGWATHHALNDEKGIESDVFTCVADWLKEQGHAWNNSERENGIVLEHCVIRMQPHMIKLIWDDGVQKLDLPETANNIRHWLSQFMILLARPKV